MRHISLFEVLAGRTEDLTGIPANQHDADFRPTGVRDVTLQGMYEQADIPGRQEPPFWRSVNNDDGYWYSPQYLPEDKNAPKYDASGFGSADISGPVIWN